jgi:hypothetical protein
MIIEGLNRLVVNNSFINSKGDLVIFLNAEDGVGSINRSFIADSNGDKARLACLGFLNNADLGDLLPKGLEKLETAELYKSINKNLMAMDEKPTREFNCKWVQNGDMEYMTPYPKSSGMSRAVKAKR